VNWRLSENVDLHNERIPAKDADRQMRTAGEILRRFDHQPGLVLADEVGMGKTFVALAVAVSVVEATNGDRPVVVMVPAGVQEKWPKEWNVFRQACLDRDIGIRATDESTRRGAGFLKLLDDPHERRNHIIFLTHGAFTNALVDPYIRLAIVRQAMLWQHDLGSQWNVLPRWAPRLFGAREYRDQDLVAELLNRSPRVWSRVVKRATGLSIDDPVPATIVHALKRVDLSPVREVLHQLPLRTSPYIEERLKEIRRRIGGALNDLWAECLANLEIELPLLILDEAHHLKNPWTRLAGLFANREAQEDVEALRGTLGGVFDRMLFLTATPFQLGHHELLQVLRRFDGISWDSAMGGRLDREGFRRVLQEVEDSLDVAQTAALRLDRAWGGLEPEDTAGLPDGWWRGVEGNGLAERARQAALHIAETDRRLREAEKRLRPWVIRHVRQDKPERRHVLPGRSILDDSTSNTRGLEVGGPAVLPFLLAARAQAIVSIEGLRHDRRTRAYFAEGLASSFEAYRHTRKQTVEPIVDEVLIAEEVAEGHGDVGWYLKELDRSLPPTDHSAFGNHPKLVATVGRALRLWQAGEKVVIFCFYIETGRALRLHVSRAIDRELIRMGAERLGVTPDNEMEVRSQLERIGRQFFDEESRLRRVARTAVRRILSRVRLPDEDKAATLEAIMRFVRAESFLVRYMDIGSDDLADAFGEALEQADASGIPLRRKILDFGHFLESRVPKERADVLAALEGVQTGGIYVETDWLFDAAEASSRREGLVPNVRLANGQVARATRERLMLAFNTPFFPEVLIASAVMAEGVDLHLNCRYLIHHDLDWNPSILEQRTGRLDRIGSKAEISKQPIVIYEPYLEATQDEKQFRVVKDRERWFNVVMGERLELDEASTDRLADRLPLPAGVAQSLALRLEI
jgi:hypothetical protein